MFIPFSILFPWFSAFSPDTARYWYCFLMFSSKRPGQVLLHLNFLPGSSAGSRRKLHFEALKERRDHFGAMAIHGYVFSNGEPRSYELSFPTTLIVVPQSHQFCRSTPPISSHTPSEDLFKELNTRQTELENRWSIQTYIICLKGNSMQLLGNLSIDLTMTRIH